jgi:flagellar basal body rod protein FlgF
MTDAHAFEDCCWRDEGPDLHGVSMRTRPADTCEIVALRDEIKSRTDGLFRLQAEHKRLDADVMVEDRGGRIDEVEGRFNRELEAVKDMIAIIDMIRESYA